MSSPTPTEIDIMRQEMKAKNELKDNIKFTNEAIDVAASEIVVLEPGQKPPKLEIYKPDVIMEAISVELKLMAKLEKDIEDMQKKIASKKKEIAKHHNVVRALGRAQKLKSES